MSTPEIQKLLHKFSQDIMAAIRPVVEQKLLADLQAKLQAIPSRTSPVFTEPPARKQQRKKKAPAPKTTVPKKMDAAPVVPKTPAKKKASKKTMREAVKKVARVVAALQPPVTRRIEEQSDGMFAIEVNGKKYRSARKRDLTRYLSKKYANVTFV